MWSVRDWSIRTPTYFHCVPEGPPVRIAASVRSVKVLGWSSRRVMVISMSLNWDSLRAVRPAIHVDLFAATCCTGRRQETYPPETSPWRTISRIEKRMR
jgi:hypothetical protein